MSENRNNENDDWELVERYGFGKAASKPKDWVSVPCIYLGKTGVTFNESAVSAYGLGRGDASGAFVMTKADMLGFKTADIEQEGEGCYPFRQNAGKRSETRVLGCSKLAKKFPDRVKRHYRLFRNGTGNGVIVADLNAPLD